MNLSKKKTVISEVPIDIKLEGRPLIISSGA